MIPPTNITSAGLPPRHPVTKLGATLPPRPAGLSNLSLAKNSLSQTQINNNMISNSNSAPMLPPLHQ